MSSKARKLNFLIEEKICRNLEKLIPAGKRSRLVNDALRKELELIRRKAAVDHLLASSPASQKFSKSDITDLLNKDRASH